MLFLNFILLRIITLEVSSVKYRFGNSYWRTVEEGSEREWLLGNGIGGFSNCTVVGNLVRTQSSYLVASLNPPVDRVNILSKIKEVFVIDGAIFQRYKGHSFNNHQRPSIINIYRDCV